MRIVFVAFVLFCVTRAALCQPTALPAQLAGQAVLPPLVLIPPPAEAPKDAAVTGKFRGVGRQMAPGTLPGFGGIRPPFSGQPVQGLSGFAAARFADGTILAISDNGFGRKATSPDVLLQVHRIAPLFETGEIALRETIFLSDPHFRVPFRIAHEGTEARYLTGADFDPESVQIADGSIWFGDEFGPWLVRSDMAGRIEAVYPIVVDGTTLRSPDHPRIDALSVRGRDWQVPRSKGIEGLALHPGTGLLWAMFESPLPRSDGAPGTHVLALAFDPAAGHWTGARQSFRLGAGARSIGDFNFIDDRFALVIERDDGNGLPGTACIAGQSTPCHRTPARVKRIVVVDTVSPSNAGTMARVGTIDLMTIADPDRVARRGATGSDGAFSFPFLTVESVSMWDDGDILVANDNNLPAQDGRDPAAAAPTEIIRLDLGHALQDLIDAGR